MASLSFKEKMAMFNKKSPSQQNIIKKKTPSPKLARRLSQLGKKPSQADKSEGGEIQNKAKRVIPAPVRVKPSQSKKIPAPVRVKPPSSSEDGSAKNTVQPGRAGRARGNLVVMRTKSMPQMMDMRVTSPSSGKVKQIAPKSESTDNVNTTEKAQTDNKNIEQSTPSPSLTKKKSSSRRKSSGGGMIAALQNKLKLQSPGDSSSPSPLSPFGSSHKLKPTMSMSRMKRHTDTGDQSAKAESFLEKSDSFRHTAEDKTKNIGRLTHDKRVVLKKKRRPRTKMKKLKF